MADRPHRTILVIDDAAIDREIYARALARQPERDYTLLEAGTGADGIDILAERDVDCVVLDYNLPDTDGLDLLSELRTRFAELPVVMLTGAGSEAIAVETMKRGCQDYVVKDDVSADGLSRAVENAIEKVRLRRELERKRADLEASQREQIELKNRFLSHVSHELRTPLTAVHQFLSLCLDGIAGELSPTQREYLEIAHRNANQLKKMIGDLMEVTRAEARKLRVELAPVELPPLLKETVGTLQAAAAEKGIALHAENGSLPPSVLGDESRIRQVLGNLLENAIKFTPEGGSITVRAVAETVEGRECVRVSVSDTGCGISEEARSRVFSRLHQENLDSQETRKGLGLGLAICKELIGLQRGRIWLESVEGAGTTFHFTLPVFSLAQIVTPALVKEDRLRQGYGILRVALVPRKPSESQRITADQSRRVHYLLGRLVYYPHDVVLPKLEAAPGMDVHYAVVATDAAGMKAMSARVSRQVAAQLAAKTPQCEVRVDHVVEEFSERDREGPLEAAIEKAADRIQHAMRDHTAWGN